MGDTGSDHFKVLNGMLRMGDKVYLVEGLEGRQWRLPGSLKVKTRTT